MESRNIELSKFVNKESRVMVVTDLCARGIDIPDVRYIINLDFPISPKIFIHRCGRTARAGKEGVCYSFFTPGEKPYIYEILSKVDRELS